ncbi:PREDICTED: uncharacterized protein LOC105562484 [Vollenhovia emeryi]|uniref:uncharacterized protein LOC105562484 n=1 Tax=Vollenhovia emeryi TaxID=411798 RepID=UPI0005F3BB0E|nr:PREDICTED: uncharacterized protein LOC105562484 [Vollenhovia emeryi]
MVGLLFHVFYLVGRCIYNRYFKKTVYQPGIAIDEPFEERDDTFDIPELGTTSWAHCMVNNFCPPAYTQRYCAVTNVLREYEGKLDKVVDFGCAELGFLFYLKGIPEVKRILCVDVDRDILERHKRKAEPLITEMLHSRQRMLTIEICEGSVTDNDVKLLNANAVICIELIEHLYPDTLIDLPFNIFGYIKPEVAIITTPNVEFNVLFPNFSGYRHPDHKFEWTRKQFQDWANNIVLRYPYYSVTFHGICNGPEGTESLGALTQMAVFHRTLPRDQSSIEVLTADDYNKLIGQKGLFNTIAEYDYYKGGDSRSDEQKVLDEALYYINYLSINTTQDEEGSTWNHEIYLKNILHFMTKCSITEGTLRMILTRAGRDIEDREDGPVVLNPSEVSSDDETFDYMDNYTEDDEENYEIENSNMDWNAENIWDYTTGSSVNEIPASANEYLSRQGLHVDSIREEPDVINEERWGYITPSTNEIRADANEEYSSPQDSHVDSFREGPDFIDEERWDYITPSTNEMPAGANEEYLSRQSPDVDRFREEHNFTDEDKLNYSAPPINEIPDASEGYLSAENPYFESWHEEPSIIIPENYSICHENTYLFNGEISLVEESQQSNEPCATDNNIRHSGVGDNAGSSVYTERELPSDSIPLMLNELEELEGAPLTASNMLAALNSLQLENSIDSITIESAVLQNDEIDPRAIQNVSRSSTSPVSPYCSSEMDNSLQDLSAYFHNELSINNQCLLNSTFCQSEKATMNTEESTVEDKVEDTPCFEESHSKNTQGSELNFSSHTSLNYNYNAEQARDILDKNQIFEDSDTADLTLNASSSNFNNKPKYSSSPRTKIPTANIVSASSKHKKLMLAMNSVLSGTIEKVEEIVSDTSSNSLESSEKCNSSIAETIKPHMTSSNSDITLNTSKYYVGFSASESTRDLCLENKQCSNVDISTKLIQDTNYKFAENDIINHDGAVQGIDTYQVLSLDNESVNHKDESLYCTLAKTGHVEAAHLEDVTSDVAQSSIRKKGLNPPRELLSSKSQSVGKYSSSDCAKEISVLRNDRFVSCKNSEDTSNSHFTSVLKSEENVGTSKDSSNTVGLINNVEAKPSSPLETPPNSWSPEIMDSGYPNSASAQDITPEYDLSSIAQDHMSESESPSIAEAPRLGVLEPIEVENGDLANNNRDDEGNNMMAVDANDIENLQPLIDVLENDLENENDIYVMQNGFPIWLLRILDMANPLDFDMQARQNLRIPEEVADDANYAGHDEGFDSSSSESESDIAYNEMEDDNEHGK